MRADDATGVALSTQSVADRPTRGKAHLWVPRELGNAGLLLGLAADCALGMPNNVSAIARMLNTSRPTVRSWRNRLIDAGLLRTDDAFLVLTATGEGAMRRSDPLPRALLRMRRNRPSPTMLRACAAVVRETIGARADRRYICTDAQRGADACLGRDIIRRARVMLVEQGIVETKTVRRGRACLVAVAASKNERGKPRSAAGRPIGERRLITLAERAARGRRRGKPKTPVGGKSAARPLARPTDEHSRTPPSSGAGMASDFVRLSNGCDSEARSSRTSSVADVLNQLLPGLPAAVSETQQRRALIHERASNELSRLADTRHMQALLRMHAHQAADQVLACLGVFDRAPRRRQGLAVQASRLGITNILMLAADVLLSRPRSPGAVMRVRLQRALCGAGEPLTRARAKWPLGMFLESLRTRRAS